MFVKYQKNRLLPLINRYFTTLTNLNKPSIKIINKNNRNDSDIISNKKKDWRDKKWIVDTIDHLDNGNLNERDMISISDLSKDNDSISIQNSQSLFEDMKISTTSTVISTYQKGISYECLVIDKLSNLQGMNIVISGGSGDKGIDFKGSWTVDKQKLQVIGQCKNYQKKIGPSVLREFESSLSTYINSSSSSSSSSNSDLQTLGIISSASGFTSSIAVSMETFRYPIIISHLTSNGILSWTMNKAARLLLPNLIIARKSTSSGFILELLLQKL
ncbi:hypothetical protein DLAC_02094 [Tieghemostelium lacteum]|uniref:Restriction endonuclease type IV Mrr domain-containing protein n=1 Tax=Tieghemostelium lacteum TaxID=361077 RepID=A0A152A421_TIELA|nr:hypothetical protein DLAC_02094 [Tieghemostelium lacteum]|eukprot:KYR01013.1 hypothetical protein DLAC_02094 [Tieghemostelium lacteum]